jgi:hypothetical protein
LTAGWHEPLTCTGARCDQPHRSQSASVACSWSCEVGDRRMDEGNTLGEMRTTERLTGAALAALAVLHVAWGLGSGFPFRSRGELANAVVGASRVPPPMACFAVAGALATGSALVANALPLPPSVRRASLFGMAAVFGARSALGFAGKTALISPGSDSERFVDLDRRIFAPICLGLSIGSVISNRRPSGQP